MREMKATLENKHCGGTKEANHNDRTFDVSNADNIGDIRQDQVWVFPDGQKMQRLPLQQHALRDWELAYYQSRFGAAIDAQRERHLKARQKKRVEGCTVKRYYDSVKTGPDSTILQVGKEWEYTDRQKFTKMVGAMKKEIEEETEGARIKVLSISVHCSEQDGSMHVHLDKSYEVKDKYGHWVQDQDKCLAKLGYKLPDETKKSGKYNNRKTTWTDQKRQAWYDIIERIDPEIKIDRTPDPKNPKTKGKVNRAITQMNELKRLVRDIEKQLEALEQGLDKLSEKEIKLHKERLQELLKNSKAKIGSMRNYINEPIKPATKAATKAVEKEEIEEPEDWEYC